MEAQSKSKEFWGEMFHLGSQNLIERWNKRVREGFPKDDRMKVILRHGEVCVKEEALEEVNEMKQSTCQCMSTQRAKKTLDSTS